MDTPVPPITDLPVRTQDYLKNIFDICERTHAPASLKEIATTMEQKAPTASEAVKKLALNGYIHREPYHGITLTEKGRQLALAMVRRHRLVETFLVEALNYGWDEVHEEAEMLEHAISDRLLDRLDTFLGFPSRDPHGDPIPSASGEIDTVGGFTLRAIATGEHTVVERIHDHSVDILRYLREHAIVPGAEIRVGEPPFAGMVALYVRQADGAWASEPVLLNEEAVRCVDVADPRMKDDTTLGAQRDLRQEPQE
ncbi:Iron-dependent repressor IdeR [Corynebacterium ciconiae DSM 44920]|uniref:metal-dependent transcriptional regulator n=1 Tax=Corynebacterium ciconiae TaxID=227319 RepID=UPI0003799C74|nr:metal-dependent transcriptional regulator [Corynebacterium ciconiae]WKD61789.1 Iron-dependent repressor IdeR [Corynebacterium ciconiae DSM 44920]